MKCAKNFVEFHFIDFNERNRQIVANFSMTVICFLSLIKAVALAAMRQRWWRWRRWWWANGWYYFSFFELFTKPLTIFQCDIFKCDCFVISLSLLLFLSISCKTQHKNVHAIIFTSESECFFWSESILSDCTISACFVNSVWTWTFRYIMFKYFSQFASLISTNKSCALSI